MNLLSRSIRRFLPELPVSDAQLAEDLTLRGIAVEGIFAVPEEQGGGSRFEMDITTNRVDAMNHYGVAREAAAIYEVLLTPLDSALAAPVEATAEGPYSGSGYPVRIEADDLCGRFAARVVRGVTVRQATGAMAEEFAALGQKPISGPVDATNLGWLTMGQPTHVFDLDTLEGGIVVRRAFAGENLRLLDGSEKTLTADDLVVADEHKALGLAGVMGGWDSRVTEATKNILVEAAWFDPAAVRASSRRHGLHTDASHRFERGADFNAAPVANHLVTRLVLEQAGGAVEGPLVDVIVPAWQAKTAGRAAVVLRVGEVQRILGTTLDDALLEPSGKAVSALSDHVVQTVLTALGCEMTPTGVAGEYAATLPSWRLDLEREIDLIEEVARVFGYNRFANTLPGWSGAVVEQPHRAQEAAIRTTLRGLGYSEAIGSTFAAISDAEAFNATSKGTVPVGNPLNDEAGLLRPSLLPGVAGMLARNHARGAAMVRLFELGTVFTGSTDTVIEATGLVLGAMCGAHASALHTADDALLFEIKGALEALLARFAGTIAIDTANPLPAWVATGRGARLLLDGHPVAVFGELNATLSSARKLRECAVLAEVDAATLLASPLRQPLVRELSRFQAVERDFSFVFPDSVRWSGIQSSLQALGIETLRRLEPLEVFRDPKGKAMPSGSHSLLLRAVFQSGERTLTEDELTTASCQIVSTLTALGGQQRT